MGNAYCIALVFSRSGFRYRSYALEYAEVLLRMQKQVVVFSPDWIELNHLMQKRFREHAGKIQCVGLEASDRSGDETVSSYVWRLLGLRHRLNKTARQLRAQIDLVFFAPADDWVRPAFSRNLFRRIFPFHWSGLLTETAVYAPGGLALNTDPGLRDPDYLFSSENCVGVATLDRFRPEAIRSRVYKKVVVLPDICDITASSAQSKHRSIIREMARDRMVVGTVLLEGEHPVHFLELANQSPSDQYFFVCVGNLEADRLGPETAAQLGRLLESGKKNSYFILHEPDDNQQLNELIRSFDVCYLNDGNLTLPHPLLTKAAAFRKPVIGSKQNMVGRLIQTFGTGITVNGAVMESLQALQTLRLQMPFEANLDQSKFVNYARLQDSNALREAWEELLWF